jgi:Thioesterase-like superfamily
MNVPVSIFDVDADGLYTPTDAALSPWSDQMLHGGPPTMLMAREIERLPADQPMFVARLTVELLRPVGRIPLALRSRLVRSGRKVQLAEASLWNGDLEVARATAVRIRIAEVDVPRDLEPTSFPQPESLKGSLGPWRPGPAYHLIGVEIRVPDEPEKPLGPRWAWFRLRLPVLPGEEPSGLQRVCAVADFPNGLSRIVDPQTLSFVNPDMTLYVNRLPVDEWVLLDARTWLEPHGTGVAEGAIYDRRGRIGRSLQSLLVEPRA